MNKLEEHRSNVGAPWCFAGLWEPVYLICNVPAEHSVPRSGMCGKLARAATRPRAADSLFLISPSGKVSKLFIICSERKKKTVRVCLKIAPSVPLK